MIYDVEWTAQCLLPEFVNDQDMDCDADFRVYRYDAMSKLCVEFYYDGCNGNDNRFSELKDCVSTCHAKNDLTLPCKSIIAWRSRNSKNIHCEDKTDQVGIFIDFVCCIQDALFWFTAQCQHAPENGICKALKRRFYYDTTEGICKQFIYGGCGGNENRFNTESECRRTCVIH